MPQMPRPGCAPEIMHNTLIFYVQVPVAYISSLILTF